jgi:hypothetical protein
VFAPPPQTVPATRKPTTPQEALAGRLNYADKGQSPIPPKYGDPTASGLTCTITQGDNRLTLDLEP